MSQEFRGKVFHGSPNTELTTIRATSNQRQFDNGTSQFGAFFSLNESEAARYADIHGTGNPGKIYSIDLTLKRPYEMVWSEFAYYQDLGNDTSKYENRLKELIQEGSRRRKELEAAGYDGIIVRSSSGRIVEIASFKDVPVQSIRRDPAKIRELVEAEFKNNGKINYDKKRNKTRDSIPSIEAEV